MKLKIGDYVLATKYSDGDPQDHWAVGIYVGMTEHTTPRYNVVDILGKHFRHNGFRRINKITRKVGEWILDNSELIEHSGRNVWVFVKIAKEETK